MYKRKPFQKVAMIIAIISYIAAAACGVAAGVLGGGLGDPVTGSFMASVVFFAGAGIVLHVIGSVNLPSFKVDP